MAAIAPVLTRSESITAITEAEAGILQCLQSFLCTTLTVIAPVGSDSLSVINDKVDEASILIDAMSSLEISVAGVLNTLGAVTLADKA